MPLRTKTILFGCTVLATLAASLPQPRGDEKVSLALSLNVPPTVNGVGNFPVTGELTNEGTQDVLVVRDPSGILYEFFTADALVFKKTDSKEQDSTTPSFVGYRAKWDMKTYLQDNIEEDEYLPDDHEDVVSLTANNESHAKRGVSKTQGLDSDSTSESDLLSDTDSSAPGSSKSGDKIYPPGTTITLPAGETVSFDYKVGNVYDFSESGAGTYTVKLKWEYLYVVVDDVITKAPVNVKDYTVNIQGKLKGEVPEPKNRDRDMDDDEDDTELNHNIFKRGNPGKITVTTNGCGKIQTSTVDIAAQHANRYARESYNYISAMKGPTVRYELWFGKWDIGQRVPYAWEPKEQVSNMFKSLSNHSFLKAGDDGGYTYDCTCKESIKAYTMQGVRSPSATNPAVIYLCDGFRSKSTPMTGFDSKVGVLIHEATHVPYHSPPADDHAYFHIASKDLAVKDPFLAALNSDNYAFFAENDPHRE